MWRRKREGSSRRSTSTKNPASPLRWAHVVTGKAVGKFVFSSYQEEKLISFIPKSWEVLIGPKIGHRRHNQVLPSCEKSPDNIFLCFCGDNISVSPIVALLLLLNSTSVNSWGSALINAVPIILMFTWHQQRCSHPNTCFPSSTVKWFTLEYHQIITLHNQNLHVLHQADCADSW